MVPGTYSKWNDYSGIEVRISIDRKYNRNKSNGKRHFIIDHTSGSYSITQESRGNDHRF